MTIDLNADVAEGFPEDAELLRCITSANVACGLHAGDPHIIYNTVRIALDNGVAVGAHPSLNDRDNFGRIAFEISQQDLLADLVYQIGAIHAIVKQLGGRLSHVKPHGALYHMAEIDTRVAETICRSVQSFGDDVAIYALSMGNLAKTAEEHGLRAANEVFADRSLEPDGTLTPRSQPGALLEDPEQVTARIVRLLSTGFLTAVNGVEIPLKADTICFHSDTPNSATFAQRIRTALESSGITLASFR